MSSEDNKNNEAAGSSGDAPQFGMMIHSQYVKDFSFENPNAPETLGAGSGQAPQMDANINMHATQVNKEMDLFEVVLEVSATAKREDKTLFLAEVQYGVLASVKNVPEEHRHPLLLIEGPKMAFPFVRQLLASAIQAGGYPPLLLNPVNFEELYKQQYLSQKTQQPADTAGTA